MILEQKGNIYASIQAIAHTTCSVSCLIWNSEIKD